MNRICCASQRSSVRDVTKMFFFFFSIENQKYCHLVVHFGIVVYPGLVPDKHVLTKSESTTTNADLGALQ